MRHGSKSLKEIRNEFPQRLNNAEKSRNDRAETFERIYYPESTHLDLCAAALLDYVLNISPEAFRLYNIAVKKWSLPGCKAFIDQSCEYYGNLGTQTDREATFQGLLTQLYLIAQNMDVPAEIKERFSDNPDFGQYVDALATFVKFSFNRPDDIFNGPKVILTQVRRDPTALCEVVFMKSFVDFNADDIQAMQEDHAVDPAAYSAIYSEKPTHLRRSITPFITGMPLTEKLKETNNQKLTQYSAWWYGSRVLFSGPEEYCRNVWRRGDGIILNREDVSKAIRPFDIATGYPF